MNPSYATKLAKCRIVGDKDLKFSTNVNSQLLEVVQVMTLTH